MLIYLAGCMSEYDRQNKFGIAMGWRTVATNLLYATKIKVFDPCMNYFQNKEYSPKGVVNQNITYLKNSDILLVNLELLDKSPGTMFEIFYAYMYHIPVIAFGENYLYSNQPHVTESVTIHFQELEDAIDYIMNMYIQEN